MANFLMGTPDRFERINKYSPEQSGALNQLLSMGLSGLQQNQPSFAPIEANARKQYQEDTIPSLAQRFTSMGAQNSSGFGDALARSGEHLESSLGALRGQFDMQNRSQLMQLLGMGMAPQDEIGYFAGRPGFLGQAGAGIAQGLGSFLPVLGQGLASGGSNTAMNQLIKLLGLLSGGQQSSGTSGSITA